MELELEVGRPDAPPQRVSVSAAPDTNAGVVLDALGRHFGLSDTAGAIQARSLVSARWLDRGSSYTGLGLLRGDRLVLTVGLAPGGPTGPVSRWGTSRSGDDRGRVAINRPPRALRQEPAMSLALPTRRAHRPPRRFPIGAMLIPLAIGAILVIATKHWEIALFSLFTPVMIGWNYVEERRARSDELQHEGKTYAEEVAAVHQRVAAFTAEWAAWQRTSHPSPDEVAAAVAELSPRVWERQPGDPDFLALRCGTATRTAPAALSDASTTLVTDPDRPPFEAGLSVGPVPVTVPLVSTAPLALIGADLTWPLVQIVALHSPADVRLVAALADLDIADWVQWAPHTDEVARSERAARDLLHGVIDLGRRRRAEQDDRQGVGGPLVVVVVDQQLRPDPALLNEVGALRDVGVLLIWTGTDRGDVPTGVQTLIDGTTLIGLRGGNQVEMVPDTIGLSTALDVSTALAPLTDAADAQRAREVPDRLSLEELIPDVASPVELRRRWETAHPTDLLARIGLSAEGPVDLDLGPTGSHVLVGGTTGSGKSELLQTMVGALAATYPPDRVGFLLVDYKGGSAFKDAMSLPHCVGVVTDLDAHLTRRVLQALDAEIRRREELLAAGGARDLTELRRRGSGGAPGDLVIVVDEFATLAKEVPEFVEGVVDIAARGRSLGLRLVLATQRPAGVITDRIRANVGVRIALRMNDEADSTDVIDAREAAHVSRTLPGRGFLRVHRDLSEFQGGYAGGRATGAQAGVQVRSLDAVDTRAAHVSGQTTLEALVSSSQRLMGVGRWASPHVPWLPAMPPQVTLAELGSRVGSLPPYATALALADLPAQQSQQLAAFDLEQHGNLLVFGTSRSGKTGVLRTIAAGLMERIGPDRLEVHALDFAGHGLHVLEGAPHCAAVVGGDDPGRVARMLRRLTATVRERQQLLAHSGVARFADLTDAPPRILVLVDSWAGATAALERLDGGRVLEQLERLVPDGVGVGVHVLLTADRRAAVPQALSSVVTTRLVMRLAERDDYPLLGVEAELARNAVLTPGRGFIGGAIEVQVAVLASTDPAAENRALAALAERACRRWATAVVPVGRMPGDVDLATLPEPPAPLVLPIAVGDAETAPVTVDLSESHLLVAGPPRSGRTTTLATLALALRRTTTATVLVRSRRSPLDNAVRWDLGPLDQGEVPDAAAQIENLAAVGPVVVLCDDVDSYDDASSAVLEALARRARDLPVRIVATADNRWAQRAYSGLVPELRRSKQALLLAPEIELDGDLVGVRLRSPLEPLGAPGRGFLAAAGRAELIQVAHPSPDRTQIAAPATERHLA